MTTRVTNLANNMLVQQVILKAQNRIQDAQLQISTLQKSQDYTGIADDSNRLVSMEAQRRRINQFMNDNTSVNLRMSTTLNSLDHLQTTISDVKGLIRDVLDDGQLPTGVDKDDFSQTKMSEIADFLNVKVNGQYIFAGSKTNVQPVQIGAAPNDLSSVPQWNATNTATTAEPSFYYHGDDTDQTARISEGLTVNYGVKASDPAFEKLVRAVRIIRSTDLTDPAATTKYQNALDLVTQAADGVSALQLNVGTKQQQLATTGDQLKETKSFLDGTVSDIEMADTSTAVATLNQDQTMLQAAYTTVVRLSSLTLTNFLGSA
jgi:flagellar hook-associated protein 3 FlgL